MPSPPSVIGRTDEMLRLADAFERGPLVTLTGLPGIGKSTIARAFAGREPHVWVLSGESSDGTLEALVVADGVDAGDDADIARIDDMLRRGARVLATSRAPLRLPQEQVVRVGPLPLPDSTRPTSELCDEPAVELFRVAAAANGVVDEWSTDDWIAVADIVTSVGGHPLAIELVAARTPALSPSMIRSRFSGDASAEMAWIDGTDGVLAAMTWSARLVGELGRSVLTAMVAFAGAVPIEAVAAVTGTDEIDVADALSELVDTHLVDADHSGNVSVFSLPPLVAEVVRSRLSAAHDELAATDRLYLSWATAVAASATAGARGETGVPDPFVVTVEADLTCVLRRSLGDDDADSAATLAVALSPGWLAQGAQGWQLDLVRQAAHLAESVGHDCTAAVVRGWAANLLAERALGPDDVQRVAAEIDAALEMASGCDDMIRMRVLALAVRTGRVFSDRTHVTQLALDGLDRSLELEDQASSARFEVWLGMLAHQDGRLDDAIDWANRAWQRARLVDDEAAMVAAVGLLRTLPRESVTTTLPSLHELSTAARRCHDLRTLAWVLPAAAAQSVIDGDLDAALKMTIESLDVAREAGTWVWYLVPPMANLALIAEASGSSSIAAWTYGVLKEQLKIFHSSLPSELSERITRGVATLQASDDDELRSAFASGSLATFTLAVEQALASARAILAERNRDRTDSTDSELTARELDVMRELARGGTNKDIASALGIRPKTVMHHTAAIYRKLDVRGRVEAVTRWLEESQPTEQPRESPNRSAAS